MTSEDPLCGVPVTESTLMVMARMVAVAEGGARSRTLTPVRIMEAVDSLDAVARDMGLDPDEWMGGRVAVVDVHAGAWPRANHHVPLSTQFSAYRRDGGWFVTDVRRRRMRGVGEGLWRMPLDEYIATYR